MVFRRVRGAQRVVRSDDKRNGDGINIIIVVRVKLVTFCFVVGFSPFLFVVAFDVVVQLHYFCYDFCWIVSGSSPIDTRRCFSHVNCYNRIFTYISLFCWKWTAFVPLHPFSACIIQSCHQVVTQQHTSPMPFNGVWWPNDKSERTRTHTHSWTWWHCFTIPADRNGQSCFRSWTLT